MWDVSDEIMADESTVLAQGLNSLTDSSLFLQIKEFTVSLNNKEQEFESISSLLIWRTNNVHS